MGTAEQRGRRSQSRRPSEPSVHCVPRIVAKVTVCGQRQGASEGRSESSNRDSNGVAQSRPNAAAPTQQPCQRSSPIHGAGPLRQSARAVSIQRGSTRQCSQDSFPGRPSRLGDDFEAEEIVSADVADPDPAVNAKEKSAPNGVPTGCKFRFRLGFAHERHLRGGGRSTEAASQPHCSTAARRAWAEPQTRAIPSVLVTVVTDCFLRPAAVSSAPHVRLFAGAFRDLCQVGSPLRSSRRVG